MGGGPAGTLLLLPQPYCELGREATALQGDRQVDPAATNFSSHDPEGGAEIPPGPEGAWSAAGLAQDDRSGGRQDLGVLPEDQVSPWLACGVPGRVECLASHPAR